MHARPNDTLKKFSFQLTILRYNRFHSQKFDLPQQDLEELEETRERSDDIGSRKVWKSLKGLLINLHIQKRISSRNVLLKYHQEAERASEANNKRQVQALDRIRSKQIDRCTSESKKMKIYE